MHKFDLIVFTHPLVQSLWFSIGLGHSNYNNKVNFQRITFFETPDCIYTLHSVSSLYTLQNSQQKNPCETASP